MKTTHTNTQKVKKMEIINANDTHAPMPIYRREDGAHLISARELYEKLEVKRQFANWIVQYIDGTLFEEGLDYVVFNADVKNPQGGRPTTEYYFTLDAGKELGMMSKTAAGKAIRRYFIAVEKQFRNVVESPKDDATLLIEGILAAQRIIEEQKPKVEAFDMLMNAEGLFSMKQVADIINFPNMGRNNLIKWLKDKNVLTQEGTPYRRYIEDGTFKTKSSTFTDRDGKEHINITTFATPKGVERIRKAMQKKGA